MDVGNQCRIQKLFGLLPELIAAFAFPLGIGNQRSDEFQDIFLAVNIGEWVVVHTLGKVNGIDIAKEFTKQFPNLNIIFITGYGDTYYKDIYKDINPCGFLEKPIQYNILNFFIKQIEDNFNARNSKLKINYNYNSYIIPYRDIIYIQSDKRLSVIHTTAEKFKTYKKLSDMLEELPDTFIRCHQSFIVNRDYVRNVEGNQFLLSSGNVIPISKKYSKNVKDLFLLNYGG